MRKVVLGFSCLALVLGTALNSSEARPKYLGEFKEKYPKVDVTEVKCNVCHEGSSKKDKNAYGIAFGVVLNAKNVKESEDIIKALVATESKPSLVEGKTFGDLLKADQLPASK